MLGAIAGDIIGSRFEFNPVKSENFDLFHEDCRFTDDTVLTVAVAEGILRGTEYAPLFLRYARNWPDRGYGPTFRAWLDSNGACATSGATNGAAMRVSPVGFAFDTEESVLREAERSAVVTHNHAEAIQGAQAVALSIFLARVGAAKENIRREISARFGYDLDRTLAQIRPGYRSDISCRGSVPESIIAFLESNCVEDAIRKAISLGGDSDTQACIAGGIAQAFYGGISAQLAAATRRNLPAEFLAIGDEFEIVQRRRLLERYCQLNEASQNQIKPRIALDAKQHAQ
jgi:ADP-ribosylglycohydrolase